MQHLGEVGGIHSPGARADRDDGRRSSYSPFEQRVHLEVAEVLLDGRELDLRLLGALGVVALVRELDEHLEVVDPALQALDAGEFALPVAERARDLLRGIRVVPEVRAPACSLRSAISASSLSTPTTARMSAKVWRSVAIWSLRSRSIMASFSLPAGVTWGWP